MVTLITRPKPGPQFKGETGAERAAKRYAWKLGQTNLQPTKETRQNHRQFARKARKLAGSRVPV